jgi:uncharacterized protein YcnI
MIRTSFLLGTLMLSVPAGAHVTVWPKQSTTGAREKYEIRVPNEKQTDMIAVEVKFPAGLKVNFFEQHPGWTTEVVRDASGAIVGARWSGKLPPMQYTEFGLLAANPAAEGELVWAETQIFVDGTKVEWSGPAGSKTPASRVTISKIPGGSR